MADYQTFKSSVLGQVIGDGQCVSLVVNNSGAYAEYLFPGVSWPSIFTPVVGARQLLDAANGQYFTVINNDHNDPNQTPQQGDVMVFDATPQAGYSNTYDNPYGHTGLCDSADGNGYALLQQNSPYNGAPVNVTSYAWHYRPCLGWLRPVDQTPPPTPPTPEDTPPTPVTPVVPVEPPVETPPVEVPPVVEPPVVVPEPTPVVSPPVIPPTPVVVTTPKESLLTRVLRWIYKLLIG
jgi:hypothetical protein